VDLVSSTKAAADLCWKLFGHLGKKASKIHEEIWLHQNPLPRGGSSIQRLENMLVDQIADGHYMALQHTRRRRTSPRIALEETSTLQVEHAHAHQPKAPPMPPGESRRSRGEHTSQRASLQRQGPHVHGDHERNPANSRTNFRQTSSVLPADGHVSQRQHVRAACEQSSRHSSLLPGQGSSPQRGHSMQQASSTHFGEQQLNNHSPVRHAPSPPAQGHCAQTEHSREGASQHHKVACAEAACEESLLSANGQAAVQELRTPSTGRTHEQAPRPDPCQMPHFQKAPSEDDLQEVHKDRHSFKSRELSLMSTCRPDTENDATGRSSSQGSSHGQTLSPASSHNEARKQLSSGVHKPSS